MTSPPKSTLDSLRSGLDKVKEITKDAEAVQQRLAEARVIAERMAVKSEPTPTDETVRCDKCGIEITTGMQAMLCPKADDCELWPHDSDIETERFAWQMWKGYAHQAFDQMRAERDALKAALASAREREGIVERLRTACNVGLAFIGHEYPDSPVTNAYAKSCEAKLRALAPSQPQAPEDLSGEEKTNG